MVHKDRLRSDVEKLLKRAEAASKKQALTSSLSSPARKGAGLRESPPCNWDTLPILENTTREAWRKHVPRKDGEEGGHGRVKPYGSPKQGRGSLPSIHGHLPKSIESSPPGKKQRAGGMFPLPGPTAAHGGKPPKLPSASLSPAGRAPIELRRSNSQGRVGGDRGASSPPFLLERSDACREYLNQAFMEEMTKAEVDKWLRDHDAVEKVRRRQERQELAASLEKKMKEKAVAQKSQVFIGVAKSVEELEGDSASQPNLHFDKFGKSFQQSDIFARAPSVPPQDKWKQLKRFMRLAQPVKFLAADVRVSKAIGAKESTDEEKFVRMMS